MSQDATKKVTGGLGKKLWLVKLFDLVARAMDLGCMAGGDLVLTGCVTLGK